MDYKVLLSTGLLLLSICIYLYKGKVFSIPIRLLFSFIVFISILLFVFYGVAYYFTGNGVTSAVIYFVMYGLAGAGFSEYIWLIFISILSVLLGISFSLWLIFRKLPKGNKGYVQTCFILFLLCLSLFFNPVIGSIKKLVFRSNEQFVFGNYAEFHKYYKLPKLKQIGEAKNLVFIYAEGLERTYFDETIFPDLIKGLRELETRSVSYTDISQDKYSHHTIGGIVAGQCGLPLISPSHANSMSGMDTYLEAATCLGDLLNHEGYHLTYHGGADLNFAGKGQFFLSHKFDEVKGRNELLPKLQNPDYKTGWGLYDDSLVEIAYDKFIELSQTEDKFAMFLLTLDTHHPKGHRSKCCNDVVYKDGTNSILNAVACSDYLISRFIKKIRQSEYSNKTVVVVVSDHLALRNTATKLLKKRDRKNLFIINDPHSVNGIKIDNPGLTLDIGSTVLPFIGYESEIGFGRDINKIEDPGSRVKDILSNLDKFEPYIMQFWSFPRIKEYIEIDVNQNKLFIDDRSFMLPVLVELNNQLETTLKFEFYLPDKIGLNSHILDMDKDKSFLLIESCHKISNIVDTEIDYTGFCLLSGKAYQFNTLIKLTSNTKYSTNDIRQITGIEENKFLVKRVAHAGGEIKGETYTNSIEALNNSKKNGFSYFEIDFVFTKDGHLVCLHDWNSNFEKIFGFKTDEKLTLNSFKRLVKEKAKFHICTLSELINWMNKNPESCLVTDIKEKNTKALEMIAKSVPNFEKRVIPQIYYPESFDKVKRMGYDQIIWNLYEYEGTNESVLFAIKQFKGSFAIAMSKERARSSLPTHLANMDIPTYTHTVNSVEEKYEFLEKYNITEVYTDFLDP